MERNQIGHEHNRGTVNHNAIAALVTSKTFQAKTERPKKGKGSYRRQRKVSLDSAR